MDIIKICMFGFLSIVLILIVKDNNKQIAMLISIAASILILIYTLSNISPIIEILEEMANKSNIDSKYLLLVFKMAGIAYLIEFAKNVCQDCR